MLKPGDKVTMNNKYCVNEKNKGREFIVTAGPQMVYGKECVWLDGYSGCYAADGLTVVMKPYTREELGDYLCENYCDNTEYGKRAYTATPDGPSMCEGRWCDENYETYLDAVEHGGEDYVSED